MGASPSPRHHQDRGGATTLPSPTYTANNGVLRHNHHPLKSKCEPNSTSNPNTNPYPTTFVQADTTSFKQVVQMLTGSSKPTNPNPIPPIKTNAKSKLYERRNSLKNNLRIISPSGFGPGSGFSPEILSPSLLDFPSLSLSPVTPLIPDPFNRSPAAASVVVDKSAEDKAIAEKGFFLHPSPVSTPRDSEPRLLPLFPETSPRISGLDRSS